MVLVYSGGLSVILRRLIETYDCDVATFPADIGQIDSLENVAANAILRQAHMATESINMDLKS